MLHNSTQIFGIFRVIVLKEINMQVNIYTENIYNYGEGLNILMLLKKKKPTEGEKDQGLCAVS